MDSKRQSKKFITITKKDLEVQTFRSGGKGGQHQNKTDSGVRIIHKESGARGESREQRSQHANKKIALKRLTEHPKFRLWLNKKAYEYDNQKTMEQIVDESMSPSHLKVEGKNEEDKWELMIDE